jgi:hypothetical protein
MHACAGCRHADGAGVRRAARVHARRQGARMGLVCVRVWLRVCVRVEGDGGGRVRVGLPRLYRCDVGAWGGPGRAATTCTIDRPDRPALADRPLFPSACPPATVPRRYARCRCPSPCGATTTRRPAWRRAGRERTSGRTTRCVGIGLLKNYVCTVLCIYYSTSTKCPYWGHFPVHCCAGGLGGPPRVAPHEWPHDALWVPILVLYYTILDVLE